MILAQKIKESLLFLSDFIIVICNTQIHLIIEDKINPKGVFILCFLSHLIVHHTDIVSIANYVRNLWGKLRNNITSFNTLIFTEFKIENIIILNKPMSIGHVLVLKSKLIFMILVLVPYIPKCMQKKEQQKK